MAKKRLRLRGPVLSVPDQHRLRIARQTIRMDPRMIPVMGGMSLAEAHQAIYELTGKWAPGGREIAARTFRAGNPRTQHKRYRVKVVATVFARSVEEAELTMLRAIEQGRQHFALPTVVRDFAPAAEVWEIDGEGRRHGGTTLHE